MTPLKGGIFAFAVVAVVGAGAAAYVLTGRPRPAPAVVAPEAAAPQAAPTVSTQPEASVQNVQFTPLVRNYTLIRDTAAYTAASLDAPQMYGLRSGTALVSAAKSTDGNWVLAMTEDGQAACIPAVDVGPYDPAKSPLPDRIDGPAQAIDTATLQVNGQRVFLTGVIGKTDDYATQLQFLIDTQGPTVDCVLNGSTYTCTLPNGMDIGRAGLFNGAALLAPNASQDYRQQEQAAMAAHRGVWK